MSSSDSPPSPSLPLTLHSFLHNARHHLLSTKNLLAPALPFLLPAPRRRSYLPLDPVRLKPTGAMLDYELLQKHVAASQSKTTLDISSTESSSSSSVPILIRCPLTNAVLTGAPPVRFHRVRAFRRRVSLFARSAVQWCERWILGEEEENANDRDTDSDTAETGDLLLLEREEKALGSVIRLVGEAVRVAAAVSFGGTETGTETETETEEVDRQQKKRKRKRNRSREEGRNQKKKKKRKELTLWWAELAWQMRQKIRKRKTRSVRRRVRRIRRQHRRQQQQRRRQEQQQQQQQQRTAEDEDERDDEKDELQSLISEVESWDPLEEDHEKSKLLFRLWVRLAHQRSQKGDGDLVFQSQCCLNAAKAGLLQEGEEGNRQPSSSLVESSKKWTEKVRLALERAVQLDVENRSAWRLLGSCLVRGLRRLDEDAATIAATDAYVEMALQFAERVRRREIVESVMEEEEENEQSKEESLLSGDIECQLMSALHRRRRARTDQRFVRWLEERLEHYLALSDLEMVQRLTSASSTTDPTQSDAAADEPAFVRQMTGKLVGDLERGRARAASWKLSALKMLGELDADEEAFRERLAELSAKVVICEADLARIEGEGEGRAEQAMESRAEI